MADCLKYDRPETVGVFPDWQCLRTSDTADIINVTIDCIAGNWMRGAPLRCPYHYTYKRISL